MLPDKACGQLVVGRRVDLKMPTVTVQYSSLGVDATVHIGSRALPSVWNFYRNTVEARPWPHVFTNVLPVCIASFVAGLVHSTVASDGPSAQQRNSPSNTAWCQDPPTHLAKGCSPNEAMDGACSPR